MNGTIDEKKLKIFGENVKKLRTDRKFSTRNFSYMVGIDPSTLYRIEIGKANPQLSTVIAMAEVLKVDFNTLIKT